MPVAATDIPQFVALAERLRKETYGCKVWDRHGAETVFARKLIGLNFRTALELVINHASDPEAKTPGAIGRKFTVVPGEAKTLRPTAANQCRECGYVAGQCHPDCPGARTRPLPPADPAVKTAAIAAARAALRQGQVPDETQEETP